MCEKMGGRQSKKQSVWKGKGIELAREVIRNTSNKSLLEPY